MARQIIPEEVVLELKESKAVQALPQLVVLIQYLVDLFLLAQQLMRTDHVVKDSVLEHRGGNVRHHFPQNFTYCLLIEHPIVPYFLNMLYESLDKRGVWIALFLGCSSP